PAAKTGAVPSASELTVSGIAPPASAPSIASTPAATASDESPVTIEKTRQACRQDAAARGVRASEMPDYIAVCVSEPRLSSLKRPPARSAALSCTAAYSARGRPGNEAPPSAAGTAAPEFPAVACSTPRFRCVEKRPHRARHLVGKLLVNRELAGRQQRGADIG